MAYFRLFCIIKSGLHTITKDENIKFSKNVVKTYKEVEEFLSIT